MSHPQQQQRRLDGKTVLVTRSRDQAIELVRMLGELGAETLVQPAIRIDSPPSWEHVDQIIPRVEEFSVIVFVSTNAVNYFFDRCTQLGVTLPIQDRPRAQERSQGARSWAGSSDPGSAPPCVAAIGGGTAHALSERGVDIDLLPQQSNSHSLAEAIISKAGLAGEAEDKRCRSVLVIRANRGSSVLRERLEESEIEVVEVASYHSSDESELDPDVGRRLQANEIDWITLTSSAIALSVASLIGSTTRRAKFVSISPTTSVVARDAGLTVDAEAKTYNMQGIVDAIVAAEGT